MALFINITIVLLLSMIAWQDFKSRAVWWPFFLFLAVSFLLQDNLTREWHSALTESVINVGFFAVQLIGITIYFSIKERKLVLVADRYIGWGDIVFLFVICFLLEPLRLILFYTASIFLHTIAYGLYSLLRAEKRDRETIPLAGGMAILLILFLMADRFF